MNALVKICGLSTPKTVDAAACADIVSHLGFIFFPKSPRNVSPAHAAALTRDVNRAKTVAVTVDAETDFLDTIVAEMNPDLLQLHGSESALQVRAVKQRYGRPVLKALAIRDASDLAKISTYQDCADMLLLDAKPPQGSDLPGGNGVSFDWSLIASLESQIPVLLSGGIDVSNVAQALAHVADSENSLVGIDVSSGVESEPGVKDISKIQEFLAACRFSASRTNQTDTFKTEKGVL